MGCCHEWPPATPDLDLAHERGFNGRTIMLIAAFPSEQFGDASASESLALEEAVVSLCRAVFGAGGRIGLRADPAVVPLVAEIAAEYREPGLVRALFSEPVDRTLASRLRRRREVELAIPPRELEDQGRGRLRPALLAELDPVVAVVLGDAGQTAHDQDAVRALGRQIQFIGRTGAVPQLPDDEEVLEGILEDIPGGLRYEYEEIPFPYVMQLLVNRWLGPA